MSEPVSEPKACNFIKKQTLTQVLSCEFCEISKSTFFYRTPPVIASEEKKAVIYYTGQAEMEADNLCFRNGTVSIEKLEDLTPSGCFQPIMICYSGHWAD